MMIHFIHPQRFYLLPANTALSVRPHVHWECPAVERLGKPNSGEWYLYYINFFNHVLEKTCVTMWTCWHCEKMLLINTLLNVFTDNRLSSLHSEIHWLVWDCFMLVYIWRSESDKKSGRWVNIFHSSVYYIYYSHSTLFIDLVFTIVHLTMTTSFSHIGALKYDLSFCLCLCLSLMWQRRRQRTFFWQHISLPLCFSDHNLLSPTSEI